MTGPYDYVEPSYWYVDHALRWGVRLQYGDKPRTRDSLACQPRKVPPDPEAWPPTADWSFHNGGGEFTNLKVFDDAMAARLARTRPRPPNTSAWRRTMEYDSERAMFEAYSKNKYDSTGVIQWMLNNAWPSMIWHLYDYYLDAGAAISARRRPASHCTSSTRTTIAPLSS